MRLRVIAGELGGRFFDSPDTHTTHPMSERMRGAMFNSLGDISGQTVLDAFAGTGAISFEALSRGAAHAVLIERDKKAQSVIAKNIESLGLQFRAKLIKATAKQWADNNPDARFDLIVADPPYHDPQLSTIALLSGLLKPNGLMLVSYTGRGSAPTVKASGVVVVDNKTYGDAALAFYRVKAA